VILNLILRSCPLWPAPALFCWGMRRYQFSQLFRTQGYMKRDVTSTGMLFLWTCYIEAITVQHFIWRNFRFS
jgi:hypothetical protein